MPSRNTATRPRRSSPGRIARRRTRAARNRAARPCRGIDASPRAARRRTRRRRSRSAPIPPPPSRLSDRNATRAGSACRSRSPRSMCGDSLDPYGGPVTSRHAMWRWCRRHRRRRRRRIARRGAATAAMIVTAMGEGRPSAGSSASHSSASTVRGTATVSRTTPERKGGRDPSAASRTRSRRPRRSRRSASGTPAAEPRWTCWHVSTGRTGRVDGAAARAGARRWDRRRRGERRASRRCRRRRRAATRSRRRRDRRARRRRRRRPREKRGTRTGRRRRPQRRRWRHRRRRRCARGDAGCVETRGCPWTGSRPPRTRAESHRATREREGRADATTRVATGPTAFRDDARADAGAAPNALIFACTERRVRTPPRGEPRAPRVMRAGRRPGSAAPSTRRRIDASSRSRRADREIGDQRGSG